MPTTGAVTLASSIPGPELDTCVELPAGTYPLGEPGEERTVAIERVLIGRWPVVNGHARSFFAASGRRPAAPLAARLQAPELADHPVTDVSFEDAVAFCDWATEQLDRPVRLPTGDEWEAAARGRDGRPWPWGHTFDPDRCGCAESGSGWTVPVTAHPDGAGPFGAEQQAGNVWEWVSDRGPDGWRVVRGGSWLDHAWGLRASRPLPADPRRGTPTTGFRIVIERSEQ
jgi:formylglycine-generating enzyme required for sulfatase activity